MLGSLSTQKLEIIEIARSCLKDELEIPGIVVAGSQSAGKSSVLESLSGVSFPTGKNITTRQPIILSIVNQPLDEDDKTIWIDIHPSFESKKISSVARVSDDINAVTNTLIKTTQDVIDKPIYLKIYQEESQGMTIIDLPGITHLSDSSENIHSKTVSLIKKYIDNPNMIILCVVPAFEDFANCEAIKLAQEVDPEGNRTLGVITKLDLYPESIVDKINMTKGNVQLKLGFIAVKNKSHNSNFTSLKTLRTEESNYFKKHYSKLQQSKWGFHTLTGRITELQEKFTDNFLPTLSRHVYQKLIHYQNEISKIKPEFGNVHEKKCFAISQIIYIKDQFVSSCAENAQITKLCEGFKNNLYDNKPDFSSESMLNITQTMLNEHKGIMLSNFLNIKCFQKIFTHIFKNVFMKDTQSFIHEISVITLKALQNNINSHFFKYANLRKFLMKHSDQLFVKLENDLLEHVNLIFNIEQSIIFTQCEYYQKNLQYLRDNQTLPESIDENTAEIIYSLQAYYHIVLCRFVDFVPMTAYYFFTTRVEEMFISKILPSLDESIINSLLIEEDQITTYRKEVLENYNNYDLICKKLNSLSLSKQH